MAQVGKFLSFGEGPYAPHFRSAPSAVPRNHGIAGWSLDPASVTNSTAPPAAGVLYLGRIYLETGKLNVIPAIYAIINAAGVTLTAGANWAGIYAGSELKTWQQVAGVWTPSPGKFAFTAVAATDVFTAAGSAFANGDKINLKGANATLPAGISTGTYFVVNASGATFKLSLTSGGAAIDITTDGSGEVVKSMAGALLAATADQAGLWITAGLQTMNVAKDGAGNVITQLGIKGGYGISILVALLANGTTLPSFRAGLALGSAANLGIVFAKDYRFASYGSGLTTLPASIDLTALQKPNFSPMVAV
jgi:hypothetical protein